MKLASFFADRRERIGFVSGDDELVDLTLAYEACLLARGEAKAAQLAQVLTPPDMRSFIEGGDSALRAARQACEHTGKTGIHALPSGERLRFRFDEVAWRAPVRQPSKVICVALNNPELIANAVHIPQDHPIYFIKPVSALTGHLMPIEIPDIGVVHPEAELAVVIGRKAKHVRAEDAHGIVFGYSVLNDVTAATVRREDLSHLRIPMEDPATGEWKMEEFQSTPMGRHKGYDTFAPMGPWIVTSDEIPDPHANLTVRAWMNEELVNEDNTAKLKFHMPRCLEWISAVATLLPGDVITLGTASSTEKWPMRKADLRKYGGPVRITIEGIGTLENPVTRV